MAHTRHHLFCASGIGRKFDEILRVIDALQPSDVHGVGTPGNSQAGDDVIIALSVQFKAKRRSGSAFRRDIEPSALSTLYAATGQVIASRIRFVDQFD
jgi:hypothetical protein